MTRVQQLARRNLVLGLIAGALVLVLILRPADTSAVRTSELPRLAPDLSLGAVRTIVLEREPVGAAPALGEDAKSLRVVREADGAWTLSSRTGYPADPEKVRAWLEGLVGARIKKVVTEQASTFDEYAASDGWTHIQVLDVNDQPLADFRLGKSAGYPDAFARVKAGEVERIVRVYNLSTDRARTELSDWAEARLWPGLSLGDVERIDLYQTDEKGTLSFVRQEVEAAPPPEGEEALPPPTPTESKWEMRAPKAAEADRIAVENLVRSFTGMRLENVVALVEDDAAAGPYGLEKPSYRVVVRGKKPDEGREGPKHVLLVGKRPKAEGEGDDWFVRRGDEPWIFAVRDYALADFRRDADAFLPKPPEDEAAPPEEAATDGSEAAGSPDAEGDPPQDAATGSPDGEGPSDAPQDPPPTEPTDAPSDK